MRSICIGIGSNQHPAYNIARALYALRRYFYQVETSPIYQTPAFGFVGDDFLNLVAVAKTTLSLRQTIKLLAIIEKNIGRTRVQQKFAPRVIDLDLLYFDKIVDQNRKLPRADLINYDFVLKPISDLQPYGIHPSLKINYLKLWNRYKKKQVKRQKTTKRV